MLSVDISVTKYHRVPRKVIGRASSKVVIVLE